MYIKQIIFYGSEHHFFQGHFPGHPIFPGIFYLREILALLPKEISYQSYTINKAKYLKMQKPNVSLEYDITVLTQDNNGDTSVIAIVKDVNGDIVSKISLSLNKE